MLNADEVKLNCIETTRESIVVACKNSTEAALVKPLSVFLVVESLSNSLLRLFMGRELILR